MITTQKTRYTLVFFGFVTIYIIALINLYVIQVHNSYFFKNLAEAQHKTIIKTKPLRAPIFDRKGNPLALNKDSFAAIIIPKEVTDPESISSFLKEYFPQSFKRFKDNQLSNFMYIKRRLTKDEKKLIESADLKDIKILKEPSRYYTTKSLAPLIGITDIDNKGVMGLELAYDKQLSGESSAYLLEKDARSGLFYFKKQEHIKGTESKPLTLTIDATMQYLVYEELEQTMQNLNAQQGAALVLDPSTGEILAAAQYPSFDPEDTHNLKAEHTKNILATDAYELGSVIKMFLGLAALEENIAQPEDIIDCYNTLSTKINGITVNTVKAHGKLTFSEVIQYSNNIGTAQLALKLGPKLYHHYKRLGFGSKLNLFAGENSGFITPPHLWSKASPLSLSFGYEISATLLQLAQAFSIIALDGYKVPLNIIKKNSTNYNTKNLEKIYDKKSVTTLKKILYKTIVEGTARRAHIKNYNIMGKTGTANLLENGTYNKYKNIYTFTGLIEKDDYKRVIITFIKEVPQKNVYASTIAAPLFERIAQRILIHDKVIYNNKNSSQ